MLRTFLAVRYSKSPIAALESHIFWPRFKPLDRWNQAKRWATVIWSQLTDIRWNLYALTHKGKVKSVVGQFAHFTHSYCWYNVYTEAIPGVHLWVSLPYVQELAIHSMNKVDVCWRTANMEQTEEMKKMRIKFRRMHTWKTRFAACGLKGKNQIWHR